MKECMDTIVKELAGQAEVVKGAVADKAIAIIEQYRNGKHHGREVSMILAELFNASNDSVERMVVEVALARDKEQRDNVNSQEWNSLRI